MGQRIGSSQDGDAEARLRLFIAKSSQLLELEYVKQGGQFEIRLFGDPQDATKHSKPEEEHLRSFMLLFRQFLSDSEPIFINRIFNDAIRHLADTELKEVVIKARELWRSHLQCGPFKMKFEGEEITPEGALDLWINGEYFHSDPDKQPQLQRLGAGHDGLPRIQLLTSLPRLVYLVLFMREIVHDSFNKGLFKFET